MPRYDYRCQACEHEFQVEEAIREHENTNHRCPECGSDTVERVFSSTFVQTSSKT